METLVLVMMILVCFSFVLKQTFHGVKEIMIISVLVAFFVGMTWPFAIEQSKTQIAAWIADQKLMLDMAVLLSIDVALTMLFCVHHVDLKTSEHVSHRKWMFFIFLKFFPGLLVFPVLFSVLVMTIFLLPGVSFQVVAWVLAVVLLVLTPVFTYGLRLPTFPRQLPQRLPRQLLSRFSRHRPPCPIPSRHDDFFRWALNFLGRDASYMKKKKS